MKFLVQIISLSLLCTATAQAELTPAEQYQQTGIMLGKTLRENPEILKQAMNNQTMQELVQEQKLAQEKILQEHQEELFDGNNNPVIGNPEGSVNLAYFTDYDCGYCKRMEPELYALVNEYPELKINVMKMPVMGHGSKIAAGYALALFNKNPEQYRIYNQYLQNRTGALTPGDVRAAVSNAGVEEGFKINYQAMEQLEANIELSRKLGISGPPALVFSDQVMPGFRIKAELEELVSNYL